MLLIQADGASKGNPGPASYGAVILLPDGEIYREVYDSIGVATNNQAEYRAILAALEVAGELAQDNPNYRRLHIQMDSKLVIEQLSGRWKIKNSELQSLAIQAQRLLSSFDATFEWIPRERNTHADALANKAFHREHESGASTFRFDTFSPKLTQPKSIRSPRRSEKPVVVWAVRHGHTSMTESSLISGGGVDPALSEFGRGEAALVSSEISRLATLFGLPTPNQIWHSPQLRATETARAISKKLRLPLHQKSDLREIEFGDWEGISMDSLFGTSSSEIEAWRGSMDFRPPGGESVADLEMRVSSVLNDALRSDTSICLVAHMMPMRAIYRIATAASDSAHWSLNFLPASVSVYRFFGSEFAETFAVNSTGHLIPHDKTD